MLIKSDSIMTSQAPVPTSKTSPIGHSLLELRFAAELAAFKLSKPLLNRLPKGDGHPVLVIPGFVANDGFTSQLRKQLRLLGYRAHAWKLGSNPGMRSTYFSALEQRLDQLRQRHNRPVTVIGWSLGGLYARALANARPEDVRQVITLGSPFAIPGIDNLNGVHGAVAKLYGVMNRVQDPITQEVHRIHRVDQVPTTSIYSESDAIVGWHHCVEEEYHNSENIRVRGSHLGLPHNPLVVYLVAKRLAQAEGEWQHMELNGLEQWLFSKTCRAAMSLPSPHGNLALPTT